jgi:uncharacterized protein YjbI with pentapeptide repeats
MIQGPEEPERARTPREVYPRLAAATPAERAEIVRGLIADHPLGRLELPAVDGLIAVLDEVDLRPGSLGESPGEATQIGPFDAALREADLRGASLRAANLEGADLSKATLQDAHLGGARLRNSCLEGADLQRADMASVDLSGARLEGANLGAAMLENADLRGATLRFANLRNAILEEAQLQDADAWGAHLDEAVLTNANLQGVRLEEAELRGADLTGANLQAAVLRRASLQGCRLQGADLRGASMGDANLRNATLADASLQELDLSHCNLTHAYLSGARLDDARFQREQLGGAIGEELAGDFDGARKGYLVLERAFQAFGDPDAASWAYRRRRRMQKHAALARARATWQERQRMSAARNTMQFATDQFVEWLCDYGESIPRVLGSILVLYLMFTLIYGLTGSVVREIESPSGVARELTRHPIDLAIFSLLALTTGSIGIRLLPGHDLALTLVGIQVFLGVALVGLLGFVIGNRIRR